MGGRDDDERLRKNSQTEAAEVFIEREAGNMIKQRGDDNERDGVAERQAMIAAIRRKNLFCLRSHAVTVRDNLKLWLNLAEKRERGLKMTPVSKQCRRFADNVPGGAPCRSGRSRFRRKNARSCVVDILWIEAGIEE